MIESARFETVQSSGSQVMQRFLWVQTLLVMVGTGLAYFYMGVVGAQSAAYGGGIALFSSLILSHRATQAVRLVREGSRSVMGTLYMGVVQRYVFVLVGLGVGLGLLNLNAEPLLIVFGVAQLAYFMPWLGNE